MKLDHKGMAILILVIGGIVIGSYKLGEQASKPQSTNGAEQQTEKTAGVLPPGAQLPPNHPSLTQANSAGAPQQATGNPDSRFTHFRVGNRNVKSLYIDGKYTWIGTSGGVIRYDTSNDTYKVFDNRVKGILSNGIFHVSKLDVATGSENRRMEKL